MATSNYITNVAIVGASGHVGTFITSALLATKKHKLTAITRSNSTSKIPEGVTVKSVDYDNPSTLVDALQGQDALIITLSGQAPHGTEQKLIEAAGEAGVPWIIPSDFSPDTFVEGVTRDVFPFAHRATIRKAISDLGKSSYISVFTGFWYEWSLGLAPCFGFNFKTNTITFFDEGEAKLSSSSWPQVGRAVASLLSLPIKPEGTNNEACLDNFRNKAVYIKSFSVSQKDMFESVLRVTGTSEKDWTITKEPSQERYTTGIKEMKEGKMVGFAKMMYGRVFWPDAKADFDAEQGTQNELLGIPREEQLDEYTKIAIERGKAPSLFD